MNTLVVATPFRRNDFIISRLEKELDHYRVLRIFDRDELNAECLEKCDPQWIFFPHWPWKIPGYIHNTYKCVIFHMTDLPYGRGGSPLQNLIVRGYKQTVLSALKCVAEIDAGPVYRKVPLSLNGTAEEILNRAAHLICDIIVDITESNPVPSPQIGKVVEFKRRRPQDGDISSLASTEQTYDFIRMLDADNYPPAFIQTAHLRYEFYDAILEGDCVKAKVRITRLIDE